MTTDDRIRDQKLQYDINREVAKISTLSSGKIGKILTADQRRVKEQAKFTHFSLGKALQKQKITIEDQERKQIYANKSN